jgi:hypothetical protein
VAKLANQAEIVAVAALNNSPKSKVIPQLGYQSTKNYGLLLSLGIKISLVLQALITITTLD